MNLDKFYRTLGITGNEDDRSIKRAFIKVAQRCHPDKNLESSEASEKFLDAKAAYENIIAYRRRKP
tara:strand:- start:465 stop:662 length:198 start_codon:yes stop_codon:yes gene_type:complete